MLCPSCGGTDREAIAPGYWRCRSRIVADVVPPGVASNPGPAPIPVSGPCGREYQEASGPQALECDCGTFAIGRCAVCGTPVCGLHGRMFRDQRLCPDDLHQAKQEADLAQERQSEAAEAAAKGELRQKIDLLKGVADPIEALMLTMVHLCGFGEPNTDDADRLYEHRFTHMQKRPAFGMQGDPPPPELSILFPELWPPDGAFDLQRSPPWDGARIALWFADRARDKDIPSDRSEVICFEGNPGLFGRSSTKRERRAVWVIKLGGTLNASNEHFHDVSVSREGDLLVGSLLLSRDRSRRDPSRADPMERLNISGYGLAKMAGILGLTLGT